MAASKASRVLTMLERAKLVCWFEETNSYTQTARRYRTEFGMEPPAREQVKKWHDNFLSTGSISSKKNGGAEEQHQTQQQQQMKTTNFSGNDRLGEELEGQLKM